ncbi:uncharacterized protein [Watersipora subatra]|uniref:uncharacterized protein n=1 Tax=Watersipora subatra TaxID=2589382 RepID=UPI00355B0BD2
MPAANDYGSSVPLRRVSKTIPKKLLENINLALESITIESIGETNALIYSTATVVLEQMGIKPLSTKLQATPSWQLSLQNKIKDLRKKVSRLSERSNHSLERSKRETTIEALESAKQQLVALSPRLKRYTNERHNKRMNKLFINNPCKMYSQFKGELRRPMSDPPQSSTSKFWKDIWEKKTTHHTTANWLKRLKKSHQHTVAQQGLTISKVDIKCKVQSMNNWAVPGHDMIQAFWLKKSTSLYTKMAKQMECLIEEGDHSEWLTKGRTVLLIKDPMQGPTPKNYRPIIWIHECFSMYNVHPALVAFIKMSMTKWKTELEANGKKLATVKNQARHLSR